MPTAMPTESLYKGAATSVKATLGSAVGLLLAGYMLLI